MLRRLWIALLNRYEHWRDAQDTKVGQDGIRYLTRPRVRYALCPDNPNGTESK